MENLSWKARVHIGVVIALGCFALIYGAVQWAPGTPLLFGALLLAGLIIVHWKVRLPAVNGTLSVLCVLVFFAVATLNVSQTVFVVSAASLSQCLFLVKRRPHPIQLVFNVCSMAFAALLTFLTYHAPLLHQWRFPSSVCLLIAATAFFFANTIPIALVISLTESKPFAEIWRDCYFWSLPFYLAGAGIAALTSAAYRHIGWQASVMILPAVYIIYRSYNLYIGRVEDQRKHSEEISGLHLRTIEALALAIEAKDQTTANHLARVQIYAVEIGKELKMSPKEIEALRAASLLHDIGKLAVPEHIISKPGKLTREEFEKMKIHPVVGAEILERVNFPYPVTPIVRSHHEKWNGEGYPDGLSGETIPLGARILAAVDCLDALASDRQYRKALPVAEAMAIISAESGKAFDPQVVEVLERRHQELEKMTHGPGVTPVEGLSIDIRVERGAAPAAGFENVAQDAEADRAPAQFISSIAAARHEMQNLFELTRELGNSLSLEDALSVFAVRLKNLVPYDCIAVYLLQGKNLKAEFVAGENFRVFAGLEIPVGAGLSGWVAENAKPIINGNPAVEFGHMEGTPKYTNMRAALSVPLEGSDGIIGVLSLYLAERDVFSNDNLRVLLSISSKLTQTIDNNVLFRRAEQSAGTDFTTGLPNSRSLFYHLDAEVARCERLGQPLHVVVGDLDGFKQVNDHLGHLTGNRVLKEVADALRARCRPYDYIARMGGDEFVLVVPEAELSTLKSRLPELRDSVVEIGSRLGNGLPLSISFGVATHGIDGTDSDSLLSKSDQLMYDAKRQRKLRQQSALYPVKRTA